MSVPQMPQWETLTSMSVSVKGLGVKVVYVRGLVASWATQPWNVFGGEDISIDCDMVFQYESNVGCRYI